MEICSRLLCVGCGNCVCCCPNHAVSLLNDDEGFLKYQVNEAECDDCGICRTVCPAKGKEEKNDGTLPPEYFSAKASFSIRKVSSSGGVFQVFADQELFSGGYVCGAVWTENLAVKHIVSREPLEIAGMRGSKYLQSDLALTQETIQNILQRGGDVLFTGLPCQCAAIKKYCNTNADNLLLVEVACRGIPSPLVFKKYIKECFGEGATPERVEFRLKEPWGWGNEMFIHFRDVSPYFSGPQNDLWWQIYYEGLSFGTQCGRHCAYCGNLSCADLTIGDYWGLSEEKRKDADNRMGVSVIIARTAKGKEFLTRIPSTQLLLQHITESEAEKNNYIHHPFVFDDRNRKRFFNGIRTHGLRASFENEYAFIHKGIGITGLWQINNFGGNLTAWSLYKVLEEMGYNPCFIVYWPDGTDYKNNETLWRECKFTRPYGDKQDLMHVNNRFATIIVGSDQCWRSGYTKDFDYRMFLDYVFNSVRKISYGTSLGNSIYEGNLQERARVKELLSRFDAISVREKSGLKILQKDFGITDGVHVIDPIFLAGRRYIDKLIQEKKKADDKYIFVYCLDFSENLSQLIKRIASNNRMPVRFMSGPDATDYFQLKEEFETVEGGQVEDWINEIANASYVITDSFHGTCLAIMYHKEFTVYLNLNRGLDRFYSLLEPLNLLDHCVCSWEMDSSQTSYVHQDPIRWQVVDASLEKFRHDSLTWLTGILDAPCSPRCDYKEERDFEIRCAEFRQYMEQTIVLYFQSILHTRSRVAFRGGGTHTSHLLQLLSPLFNRLQVKVEYIVDANANLKHEISCVTPMQFYSEGLFKNIDYLIISSSKYDEEFFREAQEYLAAAKILDPYDILKSQLAPGLAWYEY